MDLKDELGLRIGSRSQGAQHDPVGLKEVELSALDGDGSHGLPAVRTDGPHDVVELVPGTDAQVANVALDVAKLAEDMELVVTNGRLDRDVVAPLVGFVGVVSALPVVHVSCQAIGRPIFGPANVLLRSSQKF